MRRFTIQSLLVAFMLLFALPLSAQELTVKSFVLVPDDATAKDEKYQRTDNNGNFAGLVKVIIPREGVELDGGMVLDQRKWAMGEYWVWMADGATKLTVRAPGYQALEVNFRNYDFQMLHSKNTYKLVITVPTVGMSQDEGMSYLAMTIEPKTATLKVGNIERTTTNGEITVFLPNGTHNYVVTAPDCSPQEGSVTLDGSKKQLNIRLNSSLARMDVSCATTTAKIYIDDTYRGTGSWSGELPVGYYKVEARLDGYRSYKETVDLSSSSYRSVSIPALEVSAGALNVNYSPIDSDVYVDGSKVGTTPDIFRNIGVGSHKVEIRKDGYTTASLNAMVRDNETAELSGSLTQSAVTVQKMKVRGHVKTEDGEDAIGVSVFVKNENVHQSGTITDLEGYFQGEYKSGDILVFRYIGYKPQEAPAKDGMEVIMHELSEIEFKAEIKAAKVQMKAQRKAEKEASKRK